MALSFRSVQVAYAILSTVVPEAEFHGITEFQDGMEGRTGIIFGEGPKADGGYETIFINIRKVTDDQVQTFLNLAENVPNTSFNKNLLNNITRLGFY